MAKSKKYIDKEFRDILDNLLTRDIFFEKMNELLGELRKTCRKNVIEHL